MKGYSLTKYLLSISFSIFLFLSLMISHDYTEYPWNQVYEMVVVFFLISLLFFNKRILVLIFCAIFGVLLWIVNAYIGHPIDYLLKSFLVAVLLLIAIFSRKKNTSVA